MSGLTALSVPSVVLHGPDKSKVAASPYSQACGCFSGSVGALAALARRVNAWSWVRPGGPPLGDDRGPSDVRPLALSPDESNGHAAAQD